MEEMCIVCRNEVAVFGMLACDSCAEFGSKAEFRRQDELTEMYRLASDE